MSRSNPLVLPFGADCVPAVAAELGAIVAVEPYAAGGAGVCRLTVAPAGPSTTLLLWLGLARVDARVGPATLVFKGVTTVLIYPGVEVMFRRGDGGWLFVTRAGHVHIAV